MRVGRARRIAVAALPLGLFFVALYLGSSAFDLHRASGAMANAPGLNQRLYNAALVRACGGGEANLVFIGPAGGEQPQAESTLAFLDGRRPSIRCEEVPLSLATGTLDSMQQASRYLIATIASVWIASGPSWEGFSIFVGTLFGASVVGAFYATHLVAGPWLATLVAGALACSPLQLAALVDIRDYSKAPFFLFTALVCVVALTHRLRVATLVALAATTGVVLGVGFGMRTDIAINLLPAVGALAVFSKLVGDRQLVARVGAVAVACGAFALVAWPVLGAGVGVVRRGTGRSSAWPRATTAHSVSTAGSITLAISTVTAMWPLWWMRFRPASRALMPPYCWGLQPTKRPADAIFSRS